MNKHGQPAIHAGNSWKYKLRETATGYLFVWPYVIGFIVFFAYPVLFSGYISLGNYAMAKGGFMVEFVGLRHYIDILMTNIEFTQVVWKTLTETVVKTPLIVVFSLIIAILLNKKVPGQAVFRTICFLPFLLGTGNVLRQLLGMGAGADTLSVARGILLPPNIQTYIGPALTQVAMAFFDNITLILWRSGVSIILFLSGLQSISPALYEAAVMDGASEWESFWKITLPMMTNVMLLTTVFALIESFCDPSNAIVDKFYRLAFNDLKYSVSAAMSWIYFVIVLLFVGIVFLILGRFRYSEFD